MAAIQGLSFGSRITRAALVRKCDFDVVKVEELYGIDAMCRVVRARIDATGFTMFEAQIADDGPLLNDRLVLVIHDGVSQRIGFGELVNIDVVVRAVLGAKTAADAP